MNKEYHEILAKLKRSMAGSEAQKVIETLHSSVEKKSLIFILDIGTGDFSNILSLAAFLAARGVICIIDTVDVYYPNSLIDIPENVVVNRITGDFMNLNFTRKYDVIYCRHSMYYLKDYFKALTKMKELLENTGLITMITWDYNCILRKLCLSLNPTNVAANLTQDYLQALGKQVGLYSKSFVYQNSISLNDYLVSNEKLIVLAKFVSRDTDISFDVQSFKKYVKEVSIESVRKNSIIFFKLDNF